MTEAVCLTGGSSLGLAACTGVASELYELRGSDPLTLPMVTGGVIYDFTAPERSGVYPTRNSDAPRPRVATSGQIPIGAVGAARSATCGKLGIAGWAERGGQGAAFGVIGECRVVVLVVVNALGVIVDRHGNVVRGNRDPATGQRSHFTAAEMVHGAERQRKLFARATTLTVVVTDARLPPGRCSSCRARSTRRLPAPSIRSTRWRTATRCGCSPRTPSTTHRSCRLRSEPSPPSSCGMRCCRASIPRRSKASVEGVRLGRLRGHLCDDDVQVERAPLERLRAEGRVG